MDQLKQILAQFLQSSESYQNKNTEFEVYKVWNKAVGERVAKHCWPVKFLSDGTLLVGSESSAWLNQLRYLEVQILDNLARELKDKRVKRLHFKLEMKEKS